jgi:hypothetical protein
VITYPVGGRVVGLPRLRAGVPRPAGGDELTEDADHRPPDLRKGAGPGLEITDEPHRATDRRGRSLPGRKPSAATWTTTDMSTFPVTAAMCWCERDEFCSLMPALSRHP